MKYYGLVANKMQLYVRRYKCTNTNVCNAGHVEINAPYNYTYNVFKIKFQEAMTEYKN